MFYTEQVRPRFAIPGLPLPVIPHQATLENDSCPRYSPVIPVHFRKRV
jgi:hypothetical protein